MKIATKAVRKSRPAASAAKKKPRPKPATKPALFITPAMLKEHEVCAKGLRKFKKLWPNGARATLANCETAGKKGFCFWWMRDNLLSAKGQRRFDKIVRGARYSDDVTSQCPYCSYEGMPAPRAFAEAARL